MDVLLNELQDILSEVVELHESLLGVLQEEAQTMGKAPASTLLKLQSTKQAFTRKIAAVEKRRITTVNGLTDFWELTETPLTLRQIIARVPEEQGRPLEDCFGQLKQLVTMIQQQAQRNGKLAEVRLKPIDMSLRFINDWQKNRTTYSGAGRLKSSPGPLSRVSI